MNRLRICFCLICVCIFTACTEKNYEILNEDLFTTYLPVETTDNENIGVYVCGQVKSPGIYYFKQGSRIKDAVNAAGGVTEIADIESVNLAEYINDCDRIYIPAYGETENKINDTDDNKVNINTASIDELMTLPGIGQSKAQSIIDYRTEHGNYKSEDELMNITGIKEGVYNKIKDMIKV